MPADSSCHSHTQDQHFLMRTSKVCIRVAVVEGSCSYAATELLLSRRETQCYSCSTHSCASTARPAQIFRSDSSHGVNAEYFALSWSSQRAAADFGPFVFLLTSSKGGTGTACAGFSGYSIMCWWREAFAVFANAYVAVCELTSSQLKNEQGISAFLLVCS